MAGLRIEGNTSGNVVEVDDSNNLQVNLPTSLAEAGKAVVATQTGDGTYTGGTVYNSTVRTSAQNRLYVGIDTPLFDYNFTAITQDTGMWKYAFTTMTAAQSGGYVTFNTASLVTGTTGVYLQSWRTFNLISNGGMRVTFTGLLSNPIPANEIHELGLFSGTITVAPVDGIYFRLTSAGIIGVLNFNGTETVQTFSSTANTDILIANSAFDLSFIAYSNSVEFYINNIYLGTINVPSGNSFPFIGAALPVCVQQRNSGTVSGPQQYKLGHIRITQLDVNINMPYAHQITSQGNIVSQGTQGQTQGTSALYTNSLAAGAGIAMTNTTAAAGVGLGGQFAVQPTLAAGTDGILCSYLNAVGTVTVPPSVMMITGVRIQGAVTTTLTGGPVLYAYSLAYGHTALSMATAEGTSFTTNPTTKAPRRIPLGFETYVVTAAAGVLGSVEGVYMTFNSPIPVNPGEYIAICAKNLGTVTSAGVITILITFDGYAI